MLVGDATETGIAPSDVNENDGLTNQKDLEKN